MNSTLTEREGLVRPGTPAMRFASSMRGFKARVFWAVTLLIVLMAALLTSVSIYEQDTTLKRQLYDWGHATIQSMARDSELGVFSENTDFLKSTISNLEREPNIMYAVIYSDSRQILAQTNSAQLPDPLIKSVPDVIVNEISARRAPLWRESRHMNNSFYEFWAPIIGSEAPVDDERMLFMDESDDTDNKAAVAEKTRIIGYARIGVSLQMARTAINEAIFTSMAILAITLPIAFFVTYMIAVRITRPVSQLARISEAVAGGDLSQQIDINRSDEVGKLASSFNRMIRSIKERDEELRKSRDELEQRVQRRTAELYAANQNQLQEIAERKRAEQQLREKNAELESMQMQLLQQEKMASIGQLAAGVAHEINNPIGYVNSNMHALNKYAEDLFTILDIYEAAEPLLDPQAAAARRVVSVKQEMDIPYIKEDLPKLLRESQEGLNRVKAIVQDLKNFSHTDEGEWQIIDLHNGLDSTLNIVANELKYKAKVVKEYGDLPLLQCNPSQINQVFTNILVNAAHAIENNGVITIRSGVSGEYGYIEISDTGKGIAPEHLNRIFDPFFTTKPVGKGTGLGLSLSYGIIKKHNGRIEVASELGKGATFRIVLPIVQPVAAPA